MGVIEYNGFEIQATPYQLSDNGEWRVNLHIVRRHGSECRSRNFSAANSYKTREEAVTHCFHLGKQIVDGQLANFSVADL